MLDGVLAPGPFGGSSVTFHRRIDRPVEDVWAVLTDPKHMADWIGPAAIELKVGGRYRLQFREGPDGQADPPPIVGEITRLDPPRLLEHSWREGDGPQSTVCWTLEPDGDGCRLTLVHTLPAGEPDVIGFMSGWHDLLDTLPEAASGRFAPHDNARWRALDERYRAREVAAVADADRLGVFLDGGRTLRFERRLPGPVERVWDYLTRPELVEQWFTEQRIEPRVGGRVEGRFGAGDVWTATVTDWSPPRRLAFRSDDGVQSVWELAPDGDRVKFVFVQSGLRPHAGVASGWHGYLDSLEDHLAGREPRAHGALWAAVQDEYEARFAALAG